jgi:hypothetical protein
LLIPFDDYPIHQTALPLAHAGGGHPNHYDRFWFNGYTEDLYFAVALGIYPNRGVIDAAFSVVHAGVQRSVFASGRAPTDRTVTRVGPISIELVEPMRVNRVRVHAPEHGLVADLEFTTRTALCEEPRQTRWSGTQLRMDVTRATALGGWTGRLEVAGHQVPLPSRLWGTKDRSWGLRPVGDPTPTAPEKTVPQVFFLWAPLNFADQGLHFMVFEDARGRPWAQSGALLPLLGEGDPVTGGPDREVQHVEMAHSVRWVPGSRRAAGAELSLRLPGGTEIVELEPLLTFRMRGAGYLHPTYSHGRWHGELVVDGEQHSVEELDGLALDRVHVQQVVRARWRDRVGLGVLEQLVIGPHTPSGFAALLDGAPQQGSVETTHTT